MNRNCAQRGSTRIFQQSLAAAVSKNTVCTVSDKNQTEKRYLRKNSTNTDDLDEIITQGLKNIGKPSAGVRKCPDTPASHPSRGRGRGRTSDDSGHSERPLANTTARDNHCKIEHGTHESVDDQLSTQQLDKGEVSNGNEMSELSLGKNVMKYANGAGSVDMEQPQDMLQHSVSCSAQMTVDLPDLVKGQLCLNETFDALKQADSMNTSCQPRPKEDDNTKMVIDLQEGTEISQPTEPADGLELNKGNSRMAGARSDVTKMAATLQQKTHHNENSKNILCCRAYGSNTLKVKETNSQHGVRDKYGGKTGRCLNSHSSRMESKAIQACEHNQHSSQEKRSGWNGSRTSNFNSFENKRYTGNIPSGSNRSTSFLKADLRVQNAPCFPKTALPTCDVKRDQISLRQAASFPREAISPNKEDWDRECRYREERGQGVVPAGTPNTETNGVSVPIKSDKPEVQNMDAGEPNFSAVNKMMDPKNIFETEKKFVQEVDEKIQRMQCVNLMINALYKSYNNHPCEEDVVHRLPTVAQGRQKEEEGVLLSASDRDRESAAETYGAGEIELVSSHSTYTDKPLHDCIVQVTSVCKDDVSTVCGACDLSSSYDTYETAKSDSDRTNDLSTNRNSQSVCMERPRTTEVLDLNDSHSPENISDFKNSVLYVKGDNCCSVHQTPPGALQGVKDNILEQRPCAESNNTSDICSMSSSDAVNGTYSELSTDCEPDLGSQSDTGQESSPIRSCFSEAQGWPCGPHHHPHLDHPYFYFYPRLFPAWRNYVEYQQSQTPQDIPKNFYSEHHLCHGIPHPESSLPSIPPRYLQLLPETVDSDEAKDKIDMFVESCRTDIYHHLLNLRESDPLTYAGFSFNVCSSRPHQYPLQHNSHSHYPSTIPGLRERKRSSFPPFPSPYWQWGPRSQWNSRSMSTPAGDAASVRSSMAYLPPPPPPVSHSEATSAAAKRAGLSSMSYPPPPPPPPPSASSDNTSTPATRASLSGKSYVPPPPAAYGNDSASTDPRRAGFDGSINPWMYSYWGLDMPFIDRQSVIERAHSQFPPNPYFDYWNRKMDSPDSRTGYQGYIPSNATKARTQLYQAMEKETKERTYGEAEGYCHLETNSDTHTEVSCASTTKKRSRNLSGPTETVIGDSGNGEEVTMEQSPTKPPFKTTKKNDRRGQCKRREYVNKSFSPPEQSGSNWRKSQDFCEYKNQDHVSNFSPQEQFSGDWRKSEEAQKFSTASETLKKQQASTATPDIKPAAYSYGSKSVCSTANLSLANKDGSFDGTVDVEAAAGHYYQRDPRRPFFLKETDRTRPKSEVVSSEYMTNFREQLDLNESIKEEGDGHFHGTRRRSDFQYRKKRTKGKGMDRRGLPDSADEGRFRRYTNSDWPWAHQRFYTYNDSTSSSQSEVTSMNSQVLKEWTESSKTYQHKFIDSHCHIDFLYTRLNIFKPIPFKDFQKKNAGLFPANYEGCVAVFCNPWTFADENPYDQVYKLVAQEDNIWLTFGCHPKHATEFSENHETGLRKALQHPKVVALGEIGLDYSGTFWQHADVQKDVFRTQLRIALETKLPLVIHCRDADDDCLDILQEVMPRDHKIHAHCFTRDFNVARRWLDPFPNLFLGLTPLISYKTAVGAADTAAQIPLDRLLLETDAPYFLPRIVRKSDISLSHPGFALCTAEKVAELQGVPVDVVLKACRANTAKMYGV